MHPGTKLDISIEVIPRTNGILCTLLILDFGRCIFWLTLADLSPVIPLLNWNILAETSGCIT